MSKSKERWFMVILLGMALAMVVSASLPGQDPPGQADEYDHARFVRHRTDVDTCLFCHGEYNMIVRRPDTPRHSLWIDSRLYFQSAHATQGCQACHTNIDAAGHRMAGDTAAVTRCRPCHVEEPVTAGTEMSDAMAEMEEATGFSPMLTAALQACFDCHPEAYEVYRDSVHGVIALEDPKSDAPLCIDCHGIHGILPASDERSTTHVAKVPTTCLNCHDQVEIKTRAGLELDVKKSFEESFHGKRGELGGRSVAICTNCHGVHDIYSPEDPRSKVNQVRIAKTCGECHEGAQLNFATGFTHKTVNPREQLGLYILKQIYKWVIFLLIAQFMAFAVLDMFQHYRRRRAKRGAARG